MIKNLKSLRKEKGVTQKWLAETIGISQQSINKYENQCVEPDINILVQLADYFDTSVDYLIGHSKVRRKIETVHFCDLNEEEIRFVEMLRLLTQKKRDCVRVVMENLSEKYYFFVQ